MKKCLLLLCLLVSTYSLFAATTQGNWRWRKNDGTEATATYLAAQNVTPAISTYDVLRVRIERYNEDDSDVYDLNNMKLQYSLTGADDDSWVDIDGDSTTHDFVIYSSLLVADGAPTTEQLSARAGYSFVAGRVIASTAPFNYSLAGQKRTEFEFVIKPTATAKFSTPYYFRTDKDGTTSNPLPALTTAATLPVKLLSFSAAANGDKALLKWITVNEVNSDHFEVLRSANGQSWQAIASVNAKGNNSAGQNQYEFTDNTPLSGNNYYRLKQYDKNGIATLSDVKTLTLQDLKNLAASVYPNPTAAAINVMIKNYSGSVTASVINAQGIVLHREVIAVTAATSFYKLNMNQKLASGVYHVTLSGSNLSQKLKVIVQ